MSAGHPHHRANTKRRSELKKLTEDPDYQRLWQRWARIDVDHDVPDLAGYNVWGTIRFIDRDFFHALHDPKYAEHLGIGPIDTGLSPEDTLSCLTEHEGVEKTLMDAPNNTIEIYKPAHEFATLAEHQCVRAKKDTSLKYERGLEKAIAFCEQKTPIKVSPDFACAPLLDEPDTNDKRVLEVLKKLGIADASKISKENVDYSNSSGEDRCDGCQHWLRVGPNQPEFGLCEIVAGAIRGDRWCKRYEAIEQPAPEPEPQPEPEPPKRRKKKRHITTRRDEQGNLIADVHDTDEDGNTLRKRTISMGRDEHGNMTADVNDADNE